MDLKVQLATRDHRGCRELPDRRELKDHRDLAYKVRKGCKDLRDPKEVKGRRDPKVLPAHRVPKD